MNIGVKECSLDDILHVDKTIVEFGVHHTRQEFERRTKNVDHLYICAYIDDTTIGYIVGYDRFQDGSFYCWMAGVNPIYRGQGALKKMMHYQEEWAKKKGYNKMRIKTRNSRRHMLAYLIKYGYNFRNVMKKDYHVGDYRISLEKEL